MGDLGAQIWGPDFTDDEREIARGRRRGRKTVADNFRDEYFYGRCHDTKTCIWRGHHHSWSEASSGITWIGVHGHDSICVVTKAGDLDVTRVHGFLLFSSKKLVDRNFRRCAISEMEDLADPLTNPHEMDDKSINTPFSVVSVVPVTNKVHDASGDVYEENIFVKYRLEYLEKTIRGDEESGDDDYDYDNHDLDEFIKSSLKKERRRGRERGVPFMYHNEDTIKILQDKLKRDAAANPSKQTVQEEPSGKCDEKKAIEFLKEKMKISAEQFTVEETVKTAISAFQRLFNKNFKANEIVVCVMDPDYWVQTEDIDYKDIYFNHLDIDEIEKFLLDMSEPESEGSQSEGLTITSDECD